MVGYKMKHDSLPTSLLTSEDFEDGLEMCSGNRIVETSFLSVLFKLTQFRKLFYECMVPSGEIYVTHNSISKTQGCADIRDYLVNETDIRPACTCLTSNMFDCDDDVKDGLWSSNNVPLNERPYKDIVVLKNGTRLSFTDNHTECFAGKDNYSWFKIYVQ